MTWRLLRLGPRLGGQSGGSGAGRSQPGVLLEGVGCLVGGSTVTDIVHAEVIGQRLQDRGVLGPHRQLLQTRVQLLLGQRNIDRAGKLIQNAMVVILDHGEDGPGAGELSVLCPQFGQRPTLRGLAVGPFFPCRRCAGLSSSRQLALWDSGGSLPLGGRCTTVLWRCPDSSWSHSGRRLV